MSQTFQQSSVYLCTNSFILALWDTVTIQFINDSRKMCRNGSVTVVVYLLQNNIITDVVQLSFQQKSGMYITVSQHAIYMQQRRNK